ncbi:MAG TPA: anaerobic ribonucleoside-triphosphate reductase activating protein [Elusimicrobia bacterium]|nr:MAG: anaerobic ribonucleoside-triphosphate reductase activating protein [Elusimicrobia bacterium RIFOXYD2_FULL_34_30]HAM38707.1 anaerobic ribonucleoside-triphosphate reductase activating protein [Elusimicrobiota bacterium]
MFVADYIETSLLDWEGKISCVLFLSGCNFRCPWCQNRDLALGKIENRISVVDIIKKFKSKKNWIDGFVITGGEPTVNPNLKKIITEIKNNGFKVKIDTNGSNPDIIKNLIYEGIIDCVAIDIKTSLDKSKYNNACGIKVDLDAVERTIDMLLNVDKSVEVMFRTTLVSGIVDIEDVKEIVKRVKDKKYYIQKFISRNTLDEKYLNIETYSEAKIQEIRKIVDEKNIKRVVVGL